MDEDDVNVPQVNIDEKNVNIAVRFLTNPNVRNTDKDKKVKFLKSKGLSDDEIALALEKSDAISVGEENEKESSTWTWWDYLKGLVLGAGILSSANYAYKAYILPYVAHEMKDDTRIESLKESVEFLKDDLKQNTYEFTCTLKSIQSLLDDQKTLLSNIESALSTHKSDPALEEIKSELSLLKCLLVKKDQFPQAPFLGSNKSAEIPAWQRATEKAEEDSEEVE